MGWKVVFSVMQIPLEMVALVAPIHKDANAIGTPVIKGVIAKVDSTSVAVVTVAPAPEVVKVIVTPVIEGVVAEV